MTNLLGMDVGRRAVCGVFWPEYWGCFVVWHLYSGSLSNKRGNGFFSVCPGGLPSESGHWN